MTTCLVVDDSRVIRKLAVRMLKNLNVEVTEAENGEEALNKCRQHMPDLVLLDWNMPVLDGLGFLKQLRASGLNPQPKVVFCTTENDAKKIAMALELGADEYIMKPFDEEILASKLSMLGLDEKN